MNGSLVTVLFGVLPVLAFVGLAVRSTLAGRGTEAGANTGPGTSAEPGGSVDYTARARYAYGQRTRERAEQYDDPRRGDG